jgi:hypothetical protein
MLFEAVLFEGTSQAYMRIAAEECAFGLSI